MSRSAVGAAPATIVVRRPSRHVGIKSAGKDGGMRKRKTYIVVAVLLVAIVGMMGLAIGCGSSDTTDGASAGPTGGAISGSAMERATAILGHGIKWKHPIWETIPAGLQVGLYDVSIGSMAITPERQQTIGFSDPYYYASSQVFVKAGGTQISGVADLAGKKVGVNSGTTYYDYLKKNSKAIVKGYSTETASL